LDASDSDIAAIFMLQLYSLVNGLSLISVQIKLKMIFNFNFSLLKTLFKTRQNLLKTC